MEENKKSYYAIIPANVRYNENITPNAKLLYGEITALCNEKGYCWATNEYFASLYNVSKTSISKWIGSLADNGYISIELEYKEGTKQILNRYLRIVNDPIKEKLNTYLRKVKYPIEEKLKDNNTYRIIHNNNTINNKKEINKEKSKFIPPTLEEIESYIKERNLNVNAKEFFDYFDTGNWIDSKGNKVKNWKQKLLTWNKYQSNKQKNNQSGWDYISQEMEKLF